MLAVISYGCFFYVAIKGAPLQRNRYHPLSQPPERESRPSAVGVGAEFGVVLESEVVLQDGGYQVGKARVSGKGGVV